MNHIVPATIALCNALFLSETDSAYNGPAITGIAIRQFIDENLTKVDVGMLMTRFGISRSPLYKLFEGEGGVYAYIRNRRLSQAMQVLSRRQGRRRPTIAQIAFSAGFENERVFSRAFQRRYGINPTDVDTRNASVASQEQTSQLLSWMKDL